MAINADTTGLVDQMAVKSGPKKPLYSTDEVQGAQLNQNQRYTGNLKRTSGDGSSVTVANGPSKFQSGPQAGFDVNYLPEYAYKDFQVPIAEYPGQSQALNTNLQSQLGAARDVKSNFNNQSDALYRDAATQSRSDLANNIKNVRANYNARGLLRSGGRQGAEYGAKAGAASDLQSQRSAINQALNNQMNTVQNNAINTGLLQAGLAPNFGASALNAQADSVAGDVAQYNQQAQGMTNLAQTVNKAVGTIADNNAADQRAQQIANAQKPAQTAGASRSPAYI